MADLADYEIRPYKIARIAEDIGIDQDKILQRALFRKMKFIDLPCQLSLKEWPDVLTRKIDNDIRTVANNGIVSFRDELAIGKKHNVFGVEDRIIALGLSYVNYDNVVVSRASIKASSIIRAANYARDNSSTHQYGVLQGPANLAGGCATSWGVLFLIFSVVLTLYGIKEFFLFVINFF